MLKTKKLILERFDRGFIKDWVAKPGAGSVFVDDKDKTRAIDMIRMNPLLNPGVLQNSFQWANIDATDAAQVTGKIFNWALDQATGNVRAYGISNLKIYKVIGTGFTDIVNNTPTTPTWPHTIASAVNETQADCLTTFVNIGGTPTYCLLYAYNRAAGVGKMGRFDITNDSNWGAGNSDDAAYALTTNDVPGATSVPRVMVKGTNGIVYIAAGYKIDSLDTTVSSATVTTNALNIPRDWEIQSLGWYNNHLVIVAQYKFATVAQKGRVAVFFWDTFSPSYDDPIYINDDFVGACFVDDFNQLYLFSWGQYGKIRHYNGHDFDEVDQYTSDPPRHGGVDNYREGLVFGSGDVGYYYGSTKLGGPKSMWYFTTLTGITCMKRLYPVNDVLHITGGTSTFYIMTQNTSKLDSGVYTFPKIEFGRKTTIVRMTFYFQTIATGADMLIRYLKNLVAAYVDYGEITFLAGQLMSPTQPADGAIQSKIFKKKILNVNELTLGLIWAQNDSNANTVPVTRIEIDYYTPRGKTYSPK